MWDSYLHLYKKYKTFTKKYNILFCPHYSLWIIPTFGMGLGRAQSLNFWYGLGPSSTCLFVRKGMGYPFCEPISYFNFTTSKYHASSSLQLQLILILLLRFFFFFAKNSSSSSSFKFFYFLFIFLGHGIGATHVKRMSW